MFRISSSRCIYDARYPFDICNTLEILNVTTEQISQIPTAQIGRTEEDEQHYKEKESYIVQHDKATPPEKCENGQDFASTSSGASIIAHSKSIIHGDGIILKEKDRYIYIYIYNVDIYIYIYNVDICSTRAQQRING